MTFSPEGYPTIVCSLTMTELSSSTAQADCLGNIPAAGDLPPPKPKPGFHCDRETIGATDTMPGTLARIAWICRSQTGAVAFPAGSKITFGKITCVVGNGFVVACVIGGANGSSHGFVVSSQKTWTF